MRFYRNITNDLIYFLQGGKVKFMPVGMRWDDAMDADMDASLFPLMISQGALVEIK